MRAQELQVKIPFRNLLHTLIRTGQRVTSRPRIAPLDELVERPPAEPTWHAVRNGVDYLNLTGGALPPTDWRA